MASRNRSKSILGVDISSEFIRMVQVSLEKRPIVERVGVTPVPSGVFSDGEKIDVLQLQDSVHHLYQSGGFTANQAHVSIPNRFVSVRQMNLPSLPESDIRGVIEFELTNIVHLPFADPVFDFVRVPASAEIDSGINPSTFQPKDPSEAWMNPNRVDTSGLGERERIQSQKAKRSLIPWLRNNSKAVQPAGNVMVVAAPRTLVNGVDSIMQSLGCQVNKVEISAVAMERALRQCSELLDSSVIVEVTRSVVNIHVFFQGVLRLSRNMPIDATLLRAETPARSEVMDAAYQETAASLDSTSADTRSEPAITPANTGGSKFAQGTLPLARELASELDRTMNFVRYTLNQRGAAFREIALVTTLPDAKSLATSIHERLDMPVRTVSWLDLDVTIEAEGAKTKVDDIYDSDFTGAIGLVLKERHA